MRAVSTLLGLLGGGALALGCGDGTPSSPATGTISGTVTFAKLFATPPPPVQHAAASGVTRAVRPLAAKTRGARSALPAAVRPFGGRASGPAFTPNELLVRFRPSAVGAPPVGSLALASPAVAATVGSAMRSRLAGYAAQGQVATTGVSPAVLTARLRVADPSRIEEVAALLRADPAVASVGRNGIVWASGRSLAPASAATTAGTDPLSPVQAWHYGMIDAPRAWDLTKGSASDTVAVVDDGIRFDHPDIAANLTNDGYDFVSSSVIPENPPYAICGGGTVDRTGDGDGYDSDPTDPVSYDFDDTSNCVIGPSALGNHGLHVAGTIGAVGNNGVGGTGVNWTVRIRPVRVLDVIGSGKYYDVEQGILYAAGLPADNGAGGTVQPTTGARVINLSLGGPSPDPTLQDVLIAATNAGALVVAAAGNDASSSLSYPAAYAQALSVSAVGPDGRLASYSSYGPTVDIAAPGGDFADSSAGSFGASYGVLSTVWDFQLNQPRYAFYEGTSMATPHVTGVAALVLAREPGLSVAALRARLTNFAVDVGSDGPDILYGAGIVHARNSLTQSLAPPRQLYARLYDATSGAVVATQAAGSGGSYSFTGLSEGSYEVFAGEDENGDHVLGSPGRRWGAFGSATAPTVVTVAKGGTYAAPFTIGLPLEHEPNDAIGDADLLYVGGSLYGTLPPGDFDVTRIPIVTAGQYTFETSGWEGACGYALEEDTIIELYDASATFIDGNDDISLATNNYCSRITTSLSAGTYYLVVYAYGGGSGGQYRVYARSGP